MSKLISMKMVRQESDDKIKIDQLSKEVDLLSSSLKDTKFDNLVFKTTMDLNHIYTLELMSRLTKMKKELELSLVTVDGLLTLIQKNQE